MADSVVVTHAPRNDAEPTLTLRAVMLPSEHGGWGLLAEPLVLALAVAPSLAGGMIALAALCAFLARHPIRLALLDLQRKAWYPRTGLALGAAAGYLALAIGAGLAGLGAARASLWPVALVAGPAVLVYLAHDFRQRGRSPVAELAGALGLSATAPAVALAAGWSLPSALGLWLLVGGRAVGAVVEVRTRLRRSRNPATPVAPAILTHGLVTVAVVLAALRGLVPLAVVVVPILLLARGIANLTERPTPLPPRSVGWSEMGAGIAATLAWIAAYTLEALR